jgi:nucleotide-binding universal stress UspA family protein
MRELRQVLCPTDFSEFSMRAYRYALSVAWHYKAKLIVQNIVELWRYASADFSSSATILGEFYDTLYRESEEQLQQLVDTYPQDGVQVERVVDQGMASESILALAEARKADLIVMGTHGRRGFDQLMLGSVTERVMRKASCPVLIVNKPSHDLIRSDEKLGVIHLSKILFCTDFSENSQRAFDHAMSLAAEYHTELTLLHVLEDSPNSAKIQQTVATAIERLDMLIPSAAPNMEIKIRSAVRIGKAYVQIIELASEAQIDLVIMAVRSRGAVFGSTTHRVIQFGPCPVLVIPV